MFQAKKLKSENLADFVRFSYYDFPSQFVDEQTNEQRRLKKFLFIVYCICYNKFTKSPYL